MFRDTASNKRIVVWNAAGSAVYAATSFLLLIIVTRVCGSVEAGVYSIGYAIAQLMLTVGVFEATTFFATDAENKFSFEQFLAFKILTCVAMVVVSIFYVASFGYDTHKALVAYSLCAFRLFEALAQFWYSSFQKLERLDLGGFASVWRSVISIAAFAVFLVPTKDVAGGMVCASLAEVAWIVFYDIPRLNRIVKVGRPDFSRKPLVALFLACLPLFIGSFCSTYLGNIPKYAIDAVGTEDMQTIFNVLFMPSFVINLFMIFFIRPTLTKLALLWLHHDTKPFMRIVAKLLGMVVVITAACEVLCAFIGIPILEWFYGIDLSDHWFALLVVLLGGGIMSASNVFYNAMVVIRAQNGVLLGYIVAIIVASLAAQPLVAAMGVTGACWAYVASSVAVTICFAAVFFVAFALKKKAWKE